MKIYFYTFLLICVCLPVEILSEEVQETCIFPVAQNGKIGFIDQHGKLVIPCEYSMYTQAEMTFSGFCLPFQIANDNSLEDMDEENTSGFFCYLPDLRTSPSGIIPIVRDGKIGFLRLDGKIIVEPQYTGATVFCNSRALVQTESGELLFLDDSGTVLMDGIEDFGEFGIESIYYHKWANEPCPYPIKKGGKWGLMDRSGKLLLPCRFDSIRRLVHAPTLYRVQYQGREQIAELNGTIYDFADPYWLEGNDYMLLDRKTGGYGVYNEKNGWIVSPKYGWVGVLSEGLRPFKENCPDGKYGYMDENENVIIPPRFDMAYEFRGGLALIGEGKQVRTDLAGFPLSGKYGYINKKGEIVWKPSLGPKE